MTVKKPAYLVLNAVVALHLSITLFNGCGNWVTPDVEAFRIKAPQSAGTMQDAKIFRELIEPRFPIIDNNQIVRANLFIEYVDPSLIDKAALNFFMVNPDIQTGKAGWDKIDVVLCRTQKAVDLMVQVRKENNFSYKIIKIGFTTNVDVSNSTKDYSKFVHFAGKSPHKNTRAVVEAWLHNPQFPKIVITCFDIAQSWDCAHSALSGLNDKIKTALNIELHTKPMPSDQFKSLMDSAGVFLVPSAAEGWGHYLQEGRANAAVLISTNHGPMNEFVIDGISGVLVDCDSQRELNSITHETTCDIGWQALEKKITEVIAKPINEKVKLGKQAQSDFDNTTKDFKELMKKIIDSIAEHKSLKDVEKFLQ